MLAQRKYAKKGLYRPSAADLEAKDKRQEAGEKSLVFSLYSLVPILAAKDGLANLTKRARHAAQGKFAQLQAFFYPLSLVFSL